ncbi:Polyamine transporter TPO5 [Nakaseomyces bracarensis]|uniref:Polyamine transporter TPO5 n=1 Tax=Nakaseomyces bracarensis TaxID=273131 RepID=A0ABR4NNZ4_9SACH
MDYTLISDNIRENMRNLDPHEMFNNLHTYVHEEEDADNGIEEVEHFNYKQELDKSLLSRNSVIGLGFGLMSPVLGMCTSMGIGLRNGGPLSIMLGFLISGVLIWFSSLSLGEIVSKFPMELHVGSAMVAPPRLKLICSWFTGWLMLIGNWTMSTSITFAGAQLTISLILMNNSDLISETHLILWTVVVFYCVVTIVGLVNLKFARFIEIINKVCVYWIIYAIIFIDILLLIFHKGKFRSLKYALFHFDNSLSGYSSAFLSFMIGFQQSNFTLQGFSMLPALADEVKKPEKDIPRGMSIAVLLATFSGLIFLLPIMFILPDVEVIFSNHKVLPIVTIFTKSTDSMIVSILLVLLILGNLIFSGIGSITTSSRAVYSFSRDRAIPRHDLWTFVSDDSQSRVPKYSIILSMCISYILGLLALISTAAFNAFIGLAVLCLCSATFIPLVLVLCTGRRVIKHAPVKIRYKFGWFINIMSVIWLLLVMVSVSFPIQIPVTMKSMNYALVVYILCLIGITVLYFTWGKYNFRLPLADDIKQETHITEYSNINTKSIEDIPYDMHGEQPSSKHHDSTVFNLDTNNEHADLNDVISVDLEDAIAARNEPIVSEDEISLDLGQAITDRDRPINNDAVSIELDDAIAERDRVKPIIHNDAVSVELEYAIAERDRNSNDRS